MNVSCCFRSGGLIGCTLPLAIPRKLPGALAQSFFAALCLGRHAIAERIGLTQTLVCGKRPSPWVHLRRGSYTILDMAFQNGL